MCDLDGIRVSPRRNAFHQWLKPNRDRDQTLPTLFTTGPTDMYIDNIDHWGSCFHFIHATPTPRQEVVEQMHAAFRPRNCHYHYAYAYFTRNTRERWSFILGRVNVSTSGSHQHVCRGFSRLENGKRHHPPEHTHPAMDRRNATAMTHWGCISTTQEEDREIRASERVERGRVQIMFSSHAIDPQYRGVLHLTLIPTFAETAMSRLAMSAHSIHSIQFHSKFLKSSSALHVPDHNVLRPF